MLPATSRRVEQNTSSAINQSMEEKLRASISKYRDADRQQIDLRLQEIDREWNVERMIETEAPTMIGLGIVLGMASNRKWFALSAFAASMVVLHNLQGWYPMLPLFRRLGLRSQQEIEQERMALRVLRGDHEAYQKHSVH